MENCSCIIPFHNEEKTGMKPLNCISKIKGIERVVCVDDGSQDNSSKIVEQKYPEFELIRLKENRGKAEAIRKGLERVETENVLLLDADLENLKKEEIEEAIKKSEKRNPNMIILKRIKAPKHIKIFRLNTLLSGQRIIKTNDLKEILKKGFRGYEIEIASNEYMLKNNKKVFWFPYSGSNVPRRRKWNIKSGSYLKMYLKCLSYLGIYPALRQVSSFCRKKA